jgi:predicted RNA-binding protein with PUA-like domain
VTALGKPVPLETIKTDKLLRDMALVKQSRLSVTLLTPAQYGRLLTLAETRPPA